MRRTDGGKQGRTSNIVTGFPPNIKRLRKAFDLDGREIFALEAEYRVHVLDERDGPEQHTVTFRADRR